jgi:hypothetical protein
MMSTPSVELARSTVMGVCIQPGHSALTRTPREAYSSAAAFVSPITPCFAAVYALDSFVPIWPFMDETFTIDVGVP